MISIKPVRAFWRLLLPCEHHRYGAAAGDPSFEEIERRLAGHQDQFAGVHPPELSEGQDKLFPRIMKRRVIPSAEHLLPREAPDTVIAAIRDLAGYTQA